MPWSLCKRTLQTLHACLLYLDVMGTKTQGRKRSLFARDGGDRVSGDENDRVNGHGDHGGNEVRHDGGGLNGYHESGHGGDHGHDHDGLHVL